MSQITDSSEPSNELERLIAELAGSGLQAFVFDVGWWVAHLDGVTAHLFRGPVDRRWWHVELTDGESFRMRESRKRGVRAGPRRREHPRGGDF